MKRKLLKSLILCGVILSGANADLINKKEFELVQSIIPNTKVAKVEISEITGLYKAFIDNGNILYVHPQKRLIFFGEIWTMNGKNLTQSDKANYTEKAIKPVANKKENKLEENRVKTVKTTIPKSEDDYNTRMKKEIDSLKIVSSDNQKYLKSLVDNGVKRIINQGGKKGYSIILIESPLCPACNALSAWLEDKNFTYYSYSAPIQETVTLYEKWGVKDVEQKLKTQNELIRQKLKTIVTPYALIVDKDNNLVDVVRGFSDGLKPSYSKYIKG